MNRLVQGEVGSGKTVVAAIAALNASESGFQTAFMAPTEILALQHYQTITAIFPDRTVALLTSSHARLSGDEHASRESIKQHISNGSVNITIGTHAIIQKSVAFQNLGLVIVDEQHRFGVAQRKALKDKTKGDIPHLLSMTATPIPRSLALALYGDLDITSIRELPAGRKPIATAAVDEKHRPKAYQFIRQEIKKGRQAFVICPLVEESDALGAASATAEYERLRKTIFKDTAIGLLHGKLKSAEKERVMNAFKSGELSILVATSVVEVGVDVPNASIMAIEGADRFGLSQLHQFRGRIGRGEHASYCFLFTDSPSQEARERLREFTAAKDGFAIAELDL
ncbi:MAG: helicase-related protein, partial [Patescibacteria group bacterium]|nr:helicase-related protein [Patescibacteria group bacterium]